MFARWFRILAVAAAILACATPCKVWAWGANGHVMVAKIAELNLNDAAKDGIVKLLGPIPISHPRIATFADFVRHNPDFPQYSNTPPWHFIDLPVGEAVDTEKFCKDHQCALDRIEMFKAVLADKTKPSDERLEALMFLVHLVGDIHQPLHCATRNDRGGNSLHVTFLGHSGNHLNLHSVWDDNLVQSNIRKSEEPTDAANRLNQAVKEADRKEWQKGTVKDWVLESHAIAEKNVYMKKEVELPKMVTSDLDKDYIDANTVIVGVQLQRGGVRLAQILNEAFK